MGIHVTIGEAEERLAELVAAALRGEEVVFDIPGGQVQLVPWEHSAPEQARLGAKRAAAFGMWRDRAGDHPIDVKALKMSDDEWHEHYERKFGPSV
jgi:hypothetical protein